MNTPLFKCTIYVLIAALTAASTEIANYHSFEEITSMKWYLIGSSVFLQSLVAVKAFLDQSMSAKKQDYSSTETPSAVNKESIT